MSSTPTSLSDPALFDSLLKFGLLVEASAPYKNLTMYEVVKLLLTGNQNITAIIADEIPKRPSLAEHNPLIPLTLLKMKLDKAPHDNSDGGLVASVVTMTVLSVLAVCLRFYSRKWVMYRLMLDDWIMALSAILSIAFTSVLCLSHSKGGFGPHIYDISWDQYVFSVKLIWVWGLFYEITLFFVRFSILIFFRNLTSDRKFRIAVYTVMALNFSLQATRLCFVLFSCKPVDFWWDPLDAKCPNRSSYLLAWGILSVGMDWLILLLPVRVVWMLQMRVREKLVVLGTFSLGLLACVGSITRLLHIEKTVNSSDRTYDSPPLAIWSTVEVNVGIIALSIPALKPMVTRFFPQLLGSIASSMHGKSGKSGQSDPSTSLSDATKITTSSSSKSGGKQWWSRMTTVTTTVSEKEAGSVEGGEYVGYNGMPGGRGVETTVSVDDRV